jgi:hypothetical protein
MQILTLAIQMTGGVLGAVWSHATVPPVAGAPSRSTPRPPSWGESMPMTYCEASTCAFEPDAAVLAIDGHSELLDYFISNVSERYSFHKADLGLWIVNWPSLATPSSVATATFDSPSTLFSLETATGLLASRKTSTYF